MITECTFSTERAMEIDENEQANRTFSPGQSVQRGTRETAFVRPVMLEKQRSSRRFTVKRARCVHQRVDVFTNADYLPQPTFESRHVEQQPRGHVLAVYFRERKQKMDEISRFARPRRSNVSTSFYVRSSRSAGFHPSFHYPIPTSPIGGVLSTRRCGAATEHLELTRNIVLLAWRWLDEREG